VIVETTRSPTGRRSPSAWMTHRGLLVLHLVVPGLLDETQAILRFIATELGPGTSVNLMAQYYPAGRTSECPEIDRRLYRSEFESALELATSWAFAGSTSTAVRWPGPLPRCSQLRPHRP
jgi:uncharacterized Fe-S radical SAM superfamily protein PflX